MGNRKIIQSFVFFGFMAVLAACASDKEPAQASRTERSTSGASKWGYFNGEPVTKWNPDGRTMTLLTELRYTDPNGVAWVAPIGSVVDGASIPRYLWSIMGGPFEDEFVTIRHARREKSVAAFNAGSVYISGDALPHGVGQAECLSQSDRGQFFGFSPVRVQRMR
jgi:hypothetical protein